MNKKFWLIMGIALLCVVWLVGCTTDAPATETAYTVTFASNCADVDNVTATVASGAEVPFPSFARDGYRLVGWSSDQAGTQSVDATSGVTRPIVADTVLYACWQADVSLSDEGNMTSGDSASSTDSGSAQTDDTSSSSDSTGSTERTLRQITAQCTAAQQAGEPFCADDIVVMAHWSDNTQSKVNDYTLSYACAAYNSAATMVRVSYTYQNTTQQCDMTYTLQSASVANEHTVFFTNSNNWSAVWAYVWHEPTGNFVAAWPGEACRKVQANEYGQDVYAYIVRGNYNSIIFNDGGTNQTADLVVNLATDGYYPEANSVTAGTYVWGASDYGKVDTVTLSDAAHLTASGGTKKVYVYTPPRYDPAKAYKVIYMFDGQNLFEHQRMPNCSSFTWGVDTAVTALVQHGLDGYIVVGIDNAVGGSDVRDSQLTMSTQFGALTEMGGAQYGSFAHGELDKLGDFVRQTLMPYVAQHYSVSSRRTDTYIVGSSSGGLAALYLGLRDSDLYGTIGAFSPATGLFYTAAWQTFLQQIEPYPQRLFLYCGCQSSDQLENALFDGSGLQDSDMATCAELPTLLADSGLQRSLLQTEWKKGAVHREDCWRLSFMQLLALAQG